MTKKKMNPIIRMIREDLEELTLRAHSGWVRGADVLNAADWHETDEAKAAREGTIYKYEQGFHDRGMAVARSESDSSWWGVRWNDAYEFIREFKGADEAAAFIERKLDIADPDGYSGLGLNGERKPRVAYDTPPDIVEDKAA